MCLAHAHKPQTVWLWSGAQSTQWLSLKSQDVKAKASQLLLNSFGNICNFVYVVFQDNFVVVTSTLYCFGRDFISCFHSLKTLCFHSVSVYLFICPQNDSKAMELIFNKPGGGMGCGTGRHLICLTIFFFCVCGSLNFVGTVGLLFCLLLLFYDVNIGLEMGITRIYCVVNKCKNYFALVSTSIDWSEVNLFYFQVSVIIYVIISTWREDCEEPPSELAAATTVAAAAAVNSLV